MENIINVQKDLQRAIGKAAINFKKSPKDRITVEYLETRLENVERDWQLFHATNTKLMQTYKSEDIEASSYTTQNMYDNTEDAYVVYKSSLKTELNKILLHAKSDSSNFKSVKDEDSTSSFVKLPKISIPVFSGKYSEWPTFRDLFISLVDKNKTLDRVQKMHYLKGHLSGEAEQLIRHTPITGDNYAQCWDLLEKRYNNKRYLANSILKRLFSQKRLNVESAAGLKELLDTTSDCVSALKNLGVGVSTWDIILIHIVTFKLDPETRKNWELSVASTDSDMLPTLNQFNVFIENRFRALECLDTRRPNTNQMHVTKSLLSTNQASHLKCEFCSENHKLCFCKGFGDLTLEKKREFVTKNKICFNCLGGNHTTYNCKKPTTCKICNRRHHSLLHPQIVFDNRVQSSVKVDKNPNSSNSATANTSSVVSCLSTGKLEKPKQVLLATALVNALSKTGDIQVMRVLLDQGSQACFITEAAVQLLRLKKRTVHGVISGLGENKSVITKGEVTFTLQSRVDPTFEIIIRAFVLNNITSYIPGNHTGSVDWTDLKLLELADPKFNISNKIDLLIGAEVYSYLLKEGIKRSPSGSLIAQNTTLGWIVSGAVDADLGKDNHIEGSRARNILTVMHAQVNEDDILKKFWEIEEQASNVKNTWTEEEHRCEEIFKSTTTRTPEGRYVVKLPLRTEPPQCTNHGSREIAASRLRSLEKRFIKDKNLKEQYTEVIREYIKLDHMRPVNKTNVTEATYLPHHPVVRNDKSTTKVRVVYNASEKNNKGISLNDSLLIGPTIQPDLRHTVLRWRIHQIALVADIIKMYRQVWIAEDDVRYQRVLWREEPEKEIEDYELLTVTFGTASAPYLAVRVLHQVAVDEGQEHPQAAEKILNNFYMDDLLTGCSTVKEGVELYKQIREILGKGGFKLQKWGSNNTKLIKEIDEMENGRESTINSKEIGKEKKKGLQEQDKKEWEIKLDSTIKILGLTWSRDDDFFHCSVILPPATAPKTKRTIIADIARLYDPLGWIAPIIITAKIFIQQLWLTGLGWDEQLSNKLIEEWSTYRQTLSELTKIRIPRWLGTASDDLDVELHGFCDASKSAYAAVVYVRVVQVSGHIKVSLLNAKTRVAPIKQVSIPRLELCGAVLLMRLLIETANVLGISKNKIRAWTDSTIVLAWLNSHPSKWKTFVANRTSEILTNMDSSQWFHVSTKHNPADLASRGTSPGVLVDESDLWFLGPEMLRAQNVEYNKPNDLKANAEELVRAHMVTVPEEPETSMFDRFSSLQRLLRVISYCRRALKKEKSNSYYLLKSELEETLQSCIRQAQIKAFPSEYSQLLKHGVLQIKSSTLRLLCPYLDENKLIRVTGRINKAEEDEAFKHPIVLPNKCHFTKLIIADAHNRTLHGGSLLMTNYLRSAYWIISGRNLIKRHVRECVICARQRADIKSPFMGSLPSVRCTPARPFLNSGVDYAGPISIRTSKGRGHRSYKGYIALFICMCTRAIHIELVSDMTTQAFLAAFRRFTSRRGHCSQLWSDNGTTFVGACKELQQLTSIQRSIAQDLEVHGTSWHFIPPHAPNFGGLWEAGVKSTKFHLKRVIGDQTLTFEEMNTLLSQIEACLNSRPISVIYNAMNNE